MATQFAMHVRSDPRLELVAEPRLNLVCFRYRGEDDINRRLLDALNDGGGMYLSHTLLEGRFVLRFSTGQPRTAARHIDEAWRKLQAALSQVLNG